MTLRGFGVQNAVGNPPCGISGVVYAFICGIPFKLRENVRLAGSSGSIPSAIIVISFLPTRIGIVIDYILARQVQWSAHLEEMSRFILV